jgi:hypothetical protein
MGVGLSRLKYLISVIDSFRYFFNLSLLKCIQKIRENEISLW